MVACKEEKYYLLGIDGGATKTHLVLSDCEMNIVRDLKTDSCNPIDIGLEATKKVLRDAIYKICDGISMQNIVMFAGISGGSSYDMKAKLHDFFGEFGFFDYSNDTDNMNTVTAGLGNGNGIALIMGTGICAFCQNNSVHSRVAGWGYLFDDGGSGYNIGRDGLAAHFRAVDGSGEATAISDEIKLTHPDAQTLLGELYAGGKKLIASYAKVVYAAAKQNDAVAIEILENNMRFAANVISTAAAGLKESKIKVVIAGGLTSEELTLNMLKNELGEKYDISVLSEAPVMGALILAKALYENKKG